MSKKIRIKAHLYSISRTKNAKDLEQLLTALSHMSLVSRTKNLSIFGGYRLEHIEKKQNDSGYDYWILDFNKFRQSAPGLSAISSTSRDIPKAEDESFTEETCAIIIPDKQKIIIQYNHYGPRASGIEAFLSVIASRQNEQYNFNIVVHPQVLQEIEKINIFTEIDIRMTSSGIKALPKNNKQSSLGSIFKKADKFSNRSKVTQIIFKGGKEVSERLSIPTARLNEIIQLSELSSDDVKKLTLSGAVSEDHPVETIDLLKHKIEFRSDPIQLPASGRVPLDMRHGQLLSAMQQWASENIL